MFWPFKKKKKTFQCGNGAMMTRNLYHVDIGLISDHHPNFRKYIKETTNFDPYNYGNNLNYLLHLYAAELIRLNEEIERLKK